MVESIASIEQACFDDPWSKGVIGECFSQPHYIWETFTKDGQVVAYACASVSFDEGEILRIAVLPSYRRLGIGEQVLARVLARLQKQGTEKVFLEVRASNIPAQMLYGKMGFTVIGRRKGYYSGNEDAVIMERRTPSASSVS